MIKANSTPMIESTAVLQTLLDTFRETYPHHQLPDLVARAPGRVNLLGGHVDFQDGLVLNIAIDREIWLAAAAGADGHLQVHATDLKQSATVALDRLDARADVNGADLPRWAQYPAGVAWALRRRDLPLPGLAAVFSGNVIMRAGLSSSAAVEEAFAIAWQALGGWSLPANELAQVGREAEREYMKLGTGIQDQFTALHGLRDHTLLIDCRTLEHRHIPLPLQVRVVVCDTNTRRELAGSSYNSRAQDTHATVALIREERPQIKTLRDVSLDELNSFRPRLPEGQYRRSRHVVTEIARVEAGVEALAAGNLAAFGALMNDSYRSARDDYGSSSPALDAMWDAATNHAACYGARYSGGGEAGAVVALVDADAVDDFIAGTAERYTAATGRTGEFFPVEPADGASVIR